jgi:hypothetical protein
VACIPTSPQAPGVLVSSFTFRQNESEATHGATQALRGLERVSDSWENIRVNKKTKYFLRIRFG